MKHSLRLKLFASFMLVIVVVVGGVLAGTWFLLREHTLAARQQDLQVKGTELAGTLGLLYQKQGNFKDLDAILADADSYLDARVWVVNQDRQIVNISGTGLAGFGRGWMQGLQHGMMHGSMHGMMGARQGNQYPIVQPSDPAASFGMGCVADPALLQNSISDMSDVVEQALVQGKNGSKVLRNRYYGEKMLVVAIPVTLAGGSTVGAVLLQEPLSTIDSSLRQVQIYVGAAGLAAVLVALLLVYWLTRRIVRPLTEMQQVASAMAQGDYSRRVVVTGSDEVGRLSLALNSLAGDLDTYMQRVNQLEKLRRDFAANVSHELRTPLTIIRGYVEALLTGADTTQAEQREYCLLIQEETQRLEHLVGDLLDLSRLQGTKPANFELERLPLNEIAASLVHKLQQQAQLRKVNLHLQAGVPAPYVKGNGNRLLQLLLIFLDNALKYTPAGGSVVLTTAVQEGVARIQIADTGRGIPAADLPYVWERFYKVDKAHSRNDSGTGLGLAIAREIIILHKARVELASAEGKGTTVTLTFPETTL